MIVLIKQRALMDGIRMMNSKRFLSLQIHNANGISEQIERISSLNVRLEDGSLLGIRPGHTNLIAATARGVLSYVLDGNLSTLDIEAGFLIIDQNVVKILTSA